ncbi:MAG TPA: GAF domain-containing protein [Candidatus Polarisedimenticolia bacterium]|nr:GAF domain-containing protein [Candidatus Polarisedimenticolia bacterium]
MTRGGEDRDDLLARGEELRGMFNKARAFTEELLRENERLRFKVAGLTRELEQRGGGGGGTGSPALQARVLELERERDDLLERFRQVEAMNRDFATRYQEIESQNNQLANLYVASYQLHATLSFPEVIDTVKEILINLIGAEAFAIFWLDERARILKTEASQGMGSALASELRFGAGPLAKAAEAGESYYADPLPEADRVDPAHPIACIPLKIGERIIGVVAIYRLLAQKDGFLPIDFELFTLLAGHAATALFSSKLYQSSEQKLNSLQGFLDMLTAPSS